MLLYLVQKCRLRLTPKQWKQCMLFSHSLAQMSRLVSSTILEIEANLTVALRMSL